MQVCRILPWTVNNYKLDELITVPELRRNVAQQFQRHSHVTSHQVSLDSWVCCLYVEHSISQLLLF